MTADRDVTGIVRAWLEDGLTKLPKHVRERVLEDIRATPQHRSWWPMPSLQSITSLARIAAAVAIVVMIALVGLNLVPSSHQVAGPPPSRSPAPSTTGLSATPVLTPSPSLSPSPNPTSTTPVSLLAPAGSAVGNRSGLLPAGTYDDLGVDGNFNVRFTVPAGWTWNGNSLSKGGIGQPGGAAIFFFGQPEQVEVDPCHWAAVQASPSVSTVANPTVESFITALAAQPMRNATTPVNRPMSSLGLAGRWAGLAVSVTVPSDLSLASCDQGQFRSWTAGSDIRSNQGPGQRDLVWAVDLTGNGVTNAGQTLIVDAATYPGTPAAVAAQINAILASMKAGHWG